ncbi:hypothetical protein SAMN05421595_0860 [Austwickia chelonae]|uniref:SDR-like Ig domain-containing protein n=1 Tax=Austwickia chelonae NBRC 105200 TaxID=1184607 RepID=K6V7Y6_9MICO|nr:Ig-like domain-containing protein [Austwickia chelonae]GAB78343.1 hypothetical protein AUCHE_08_05900 [Austwickia chelonae NBRC 105200]SEW01688.1 hypothetical protein SAMN05421595_0860 [Austwickia chelonae]
MSTPSSIDKSHFLPRAIAGVLAVFLALSSPTLWSHAGVIEKAITSVNIREEKGAQGDSLTLDMTWSVPDGTRGGDTFTLVLPDQLKPLGGTGFNLEAPDKTVVAKAVIQGQTVTFTMTDYAQSHIKVHGSAYFTVTFAKELKPGPNDLTFRVGTSVFKDTIIVGEKNPNDLSKTATKWATWLKSPLAPGVPAGSNILWGIIGPKITSTRPMTFVDTPGPGQEIICGYAVMLSGKRNVGGRLDGQGIGFHRPTHYDIISCSPKEIVVTLKPTSQHVGSVPMLLGVSRMTDGTLKSYTNSGKVVVGNGAIPVKTELLSAGGTGGGEQTPPVRPPRPRTVTTTVTVTATMTVTPPLSSASIPGSSTSTTSRPPLPTAPATTPDSSTTTESTSSTTSRPPLPTMPATTPDSSTTTSTSGATVAPTNSGLPTTPPAGATPYRPGVATPVPVTKRNIGSPRYVDTGVPDEGGPEWRLVAAGLGLIAASGLVLLLVGRREER